MPVPLYLHGSPWSVASSALRARRMHELGGAMAIGQARCRTAMTELFGLRLR